MAKALAFIDPDQLSMTVVLTALNRFLQVRGKNTHPTPGLPVLMWARAWGGAFLTLTHTCVPSRSWNLSGPGGAKLCTQRDGCLMRRAHPSTLCMCPRDAGGGRLQDGVP